MARRVFSSIEDMQNIFGNNNDNRRSDDNNYYLFWNMDEGKQSVVRFLPDKDPDNRNFLIEKKYHELPIDGQNRKFNCLENYKEKCPICAEAQKYYKAEGDTSKTGKQLYKKRKWIGQVLVIDDQTEPDQNTGKNCNGQVKLISLGNQILKPIKATIEAKELDGVPQDYDLGHEFVLKKARDGKFFDYSTSRFSRKATRLDDATVDYVEEHLVELASVIPNNTGPEPLLQAIEDYFNGTSSSTSSYSKPEVSYKAEPKVEAKPEPRQEYDEPRTESRAPVAESKPAADDDMDDDTAALLERIKNRKQAMAG
jgi:hypothetical protein